MSTAERRGRGRGSRRTDRIITIAEHAEAGTPAYWIVDLDAGPSVVQCHLIDRAFVPRPPVTRTLVTGMPFRVSIDHRELTVP